MTAINTGLTVTAHYGSCSMGGMFIYETFMTGEVIKVNAKSFRVAFTEIVKTTNGKETARRATEQTASFRFWKTLSNGKNVYVSKIGCDRYLITL